MVLLLVVLLVAWLVGCLGLGRLQWPPSSFDLSPGLVIVCLSGNHVLLLPMEEDGNRLRIGTDGRRAYRNILMPCMSVNRDCGSGYWRATLQNYPPLFDSGYVSCATQLYSLESAGVQFCYGVLSTLFSRIPYRPHALPSIRAVFAY